MKITRKIRCLILAGLLLLTSLLGLVPKSEIHAENLSHKQKVVSIVYDNSASMSFEEWRPEFAKYSLQMLASMLDKTDELIVSPMNVKEGVPASFSIDLTTNDREREIDDKIVKNKVLAPNGQTPSASINVAVRELEKRGLKKASDLDSNEIIEKDYWLIMLTDGGFENLSSPAEINDIIVDKIKGYSGLSTVYLAFGENGVDLTKDANLDLNKNYTFFPYCAKNTSDIVKAMEDIANKILGRYALKDNQYLTSSNLISIDLTKFEFGMNSITVLVQDCGAKVQEIIYQGKSLTPYLNQTIVNCGLKMNEGYIFEIRDENHFYGDIVQIKYDKPVSNITVLVEPALEMQTELQCKINNSWQTVDLQYINSNLSPKDEIRVNYHVLNSSNGKELDVKSIFGEPTEKVTYCDRGYRVLEPIPLKAGGNEVTLTVSLLNGAYTMRSSLMCYIEANPTAFRLQSEIHRGEHEQSNHIEAVYTVYSEDKKLNNLSGYEFECELIEPNGLKKKIPYSVEKDGTIHVQVNGENFEYGGYRLQSKITSLEKNSSRTKEDSFSIYPRDLSIRCLTPSGWKTTEYLLSKESKKVEFQLSLEGQDETFERDLIDYSVKLNDKDVTSSCRIENGKLVYEISNDSLPSPKEGKWRLTVFADAGGMAKATESFDFEVNESISFIEILPNSINEFDRYHINDSGAYVSYQVYQDGAPMPYEEVVQALEDGRISLKTKAAGWLTFLPAGINLEVEDRDGKGVVTCKIVSDCFSPLDDLFGSFIFISSRDLSLVYGNASATATVAPTDASFFSHFWRWCIILVIILFILHILLYIVGFFVAKHLPIGTMLQFSFAYREVTVNLKKLNLKKELLKWHLKRFIPFCELQPQKGTKLYNIQYQIDKKSKRLTGTVKGENVCLVMYADNFFEDEVGISVKNLLDYVKKYAKIPANFEVRSSEFLNNLFELNERFKYNEKIGYSPEQWYGIHYFIDDELIGPINEMLVFIPYKKTKKRK